MVTKEDLIYRQVFTLKDGARILLRPLTQDDRQALLDLFGPVSVDDLKYMRHNVIDQKVIDQWIDGLDYTKVFPLVAVFGSRIVGLASLHLNEGPSRHRAEVRIFLPKDFRHRGVGSRLLQGLIELAKRHNLYQIEAQIPSDQTPIIRSFQNLGFEPKIVFDDYFMLPDGDLRDVTHLILRLRATDDQF
jgi:RimJ/RimL family protein N-acetyltransferase